MSVVSETPTPAATFASIVDSMIAKLSEARADAERCDHGQAGAPGTRLRAVLTDVREQCSLMRKDILTVRKGPKD
jgi:hypothetical protein